MGIAVGNMQTISPLFIFLTIQFLFLLGKLGFYKKHIYPDERKFTVKEKSDVLDMLSEIILIKLKKNLSEKKINFKSSTTGETIDNISIEIATIMKNEINKNPYFLRPTITEFKNEIQVELADYSINQPREDTIHNKLHDKT